MTKRDLPDNARLVPDTAKKVFEGKIFDVYQWEQELFDGTHATFEMLKRPDTVTVIAIDDDDQIITLREEQPGLAVREAYSPGGRVDPEDASTLAAAQRELYEETGIKLREWKWVETIQPLVKMEWFIHVFIARGVEYIDEPSADAGEKIEVQRMSYEQFRLKNEDSDRLEVLKKHKSIDDLKALFD